MFTNSEMFDFYNGVTGFANVVPTAKFDSLSVQYSSDGYLSEAQYVEKLTTPLGMIDATVYANWDLLKEMSFMTNENSVVLRNYCTKVSRVEISCCFFSIRIPSCSLRVSQPLLGSAILHPAPTQSLMRSPSPLFSSSPLPPPHTHPPTGHRRPHGIRSPGELEESAHHVHERNRLHGRQNHALE